MKGSDQPPEYHMCSEDMSQGYTCRRTSKLVLIKLIMKDGKCHGFAHEDQAHFSYILQMSFSIQIRIFQISFSMLTFFIFDPDRRH